jgi:hypothetical protein
MAQSEAKLYQRLRTEGFPWVPVRRANADFCTFGL